eukprot:scaffold1586_cov126-Skeletonema_dohrnii-CCMP3373.AAC.10
MSMVRTKQAEEESTMDPHGDHATAESSNKWLDFSDGLCYNPCTDVDVHQVFSSADAAVGMLTPISELTPETVMGAINKSIPSNIIFVFEDDSFDEEYGSAYTHKSESSSFQDSTTLGSSTKYPSVSRQRFGRINSTLASYYIVTPADGAKKKKQLAIKEVNVKERANSGGDGEVELVYGSNAYLKKIGMRQSFMPLQRFRTLTRRASSFKPSIQLQGSGDSTKSLSSDEVSNEDDDRPLVTVDCIQYENKKEESNETMAEKEWSDEVIKTDDDVAAQLHQKITTGLAELLETGVFPETSVERSVVLDRYRDDSLEGSTEVLYKLGSTYVTVTPEEVCRVQPENDRMTVASLIEPGKNRLTATSVTPSIQLQGSGDGGTKSLSSDEVSNEDGERSVVIEHCIQYEDKKEESNETKVETEEWKERVETSAERNIVLDLQGDDSLEGSTEVLYKFGSTFVRVTPKKVCRIEPGKNRSTKVLAKRPELDTKEAEQVGKEANMKDEAEATEKQAAKKQPEKTAEQQMRRVQSNHQKEDKAEAKRTKKEARKSKGKANKCAEEEAQETHEMKPNKNSSFFTPLKFLYRRRNVNDFIVQDEMSVQDEVSVQEVWRTT